MPVRITQLRTIRKGFNNETFPVPDGHVAGQTMAGAGESNPMASGVAYVEISTTERIAINGYGTGSEVWMTADETRWFPATEGQTFTWSVRA